MQDEHCYMLEDGIKRWTERSLYESTVKIGDSLQLTFTAEIALADSDDFSPQLQLIILFVLIDDAAL